MASFQLDASGRLSLAGLLGVFQEAAWNHAERLGMGHAALATEECTWVLVRQRLRIQRLPSWRQAITLRTWPTGGAGLLFHRDFELFDDQGTPLAQAMGAWVVLDRQRRRPRRPEPWRQAFAPARAERALPGGFGRIIPPGPTQGAAQLTVGAADLDLNGHASHMRLAGWLLDPLPQEYRRRFHLEALEIHYQREALEGARLAAGCAADGAAAFRHALRDALSGDGICCGASCWHPIA